jgi:hypothetical protein
MIDFTFTSDEAVTNLGSLKFSQSNRMPDPKDSSRVVTTTTTTTFSMAKEMARSVCQKFLEAKFVESVEGKTDFTNKSSVWQLTPKGIHILERFCTRNGIQSAHVKAVIDSNRNPHQLVILERSTDTDKLHHDEQTAQIIFRRFVGSTANETQSDTDSIHEFAICNVGVKLAKNRKSASRPWEYSFNGRNAAQWLLDCSTMVDPREAVEVGSLFLQLKLIAPVDPRNSENNFQPVKHVVYYITEEGERAAGWTADAASPAGDAMPAKARDGMARDSNSNRTNVIIRNPSWRLLYREFLKETMCEENLSFYLEVKEFDRQYKAAIGEKGDNKVETIRETLAAAYGLYNAFLAPGSPNELNIDHALRTQLATRMTRAVGDDAAMLQSLNEVASLFEKAQTSIFKLMSSVSPTTPPPDAFANYPSGLCTQVHQAPEVCSSAQGSGRCCRRLICCRSSHLSVIADTDPRCPFQSSSSPDDDLLHHLRCVYRIDASYPFFLYSVHYPRHWRLPGKISASGRKSVCLFLSSFSLFTIFLSSGRSKVDRPCLSSLLLRY